MFFLQSIICNAVLLRYAILCIYQALYVRRVVFHKQSLALFITWTTRSNLAAHLELSFCNVFLHI